MVKSFADVVTSLDAGIKKPMTALCKLYAVHGITEKLGEFIQVCYLTSER